MATKLNVDHTLDGESRMAEIITVLAVCSALSTSLVICRVVSRGWITKAFGADDWVVVLAQIFAIGAAIAIGLEQHYGLGRHIWTISDPTPFMQTFYISILIYNAGLVTVKISIVLMYRRIFVGTGMRRATAVALVVLVAWGISLIASLAMLCLPIRRFWDESVEGRCLDFLPAFFAPASINMITDCGIFLLPLPAIRQLALPLKQKILISFILCLGLLTCVISIVRLSTLSAAATSEDPSWDNTGAALWSVLELTISTTAACLPTLRPLLARLFPRFLIGHGSSPEAHGSDGRPLTWGGAGGSVSRRQVKVSDSMDALYVENEIGLRFLEGGISKDTQIEEYKATVARRGENETVIGAGPGSQASNISAIQTEPYDGIRATTVIKQEFS